MKVKIGDKIYDCEDQPIMLILSDADKYNLSNMGEQTKYCAYSENVSEEEIIEFMKVG